MITEHNVRMARKHDSRLKTESPLNNFPSSSIGDQTLALAHLRSSPPSPAMTSGDHATCKSDCSPSEDHPDETLKRRKRHHHHRHHHGHRHRIKHDREKRAEEGSSPVEGFCPNLDEDKEEGEILDEEAVERRDNVRARRKDDSDVESGEIKDDDLEVGIASFLGYYS